MLETYHPEQYAKSLAANAIQAGPPSLRDTLGYQKKRLESQLADVNDAITALDSNPEILKALEAVQKVSRLG